VRLIVAREPDSPLPKTVNALTIENARDLRLENMEIVWEEPAGPAARSALVIQNVRDLTLDGLTARQAPNGADAPAVVLRDVEGGLVRNCRAAEGTGVFLHLAGQRTRGIVLAGNDYRQAQQPLQIGAEVEAGQVQGP